MTLKGKRAGCLLWMGMLLILATCATLPQQIVSGSNNVCVPTYPGGAGTWQADGCWYLDIETEFDLNHDGCNCVQ